jgi:hypothetical protein
MHSGTDILARALESTSQCCDFVVDDRQQVQGPRTYVQSGPWGKGRAKRTCTRSSITSY